MSKQIVQLMHKTELNDRYTPETALALSIEKWERLGLPCHWKILVLNHGYIYTGGSSCGLCKKHRSVSHCSRNGPCPLIDLGPEGCGLSSQWIKASRAAGDFDRPAFMNARKNLLRRMRAAYARGER